MTHRAPLPMNRKRDEVPATYVCNVALSSATSAAICECGLPVRWGFDGRRSVLVHGKESK